MKAKAVSALWSNRGLRRVSGAEPQVVGLAPQTTNERRTNTMKTYLLRDPKAVEPQIRALRPPPDPQTQALAEAALAAGRGRGSALFLDRALAFDHGAGRPRGVAGFKDKPSNC